MLRHWQELERVFREVTDPRLKIISPLGAAPTQARPASRWRRSWAKYIVYPWQVRSAPAAEVVHIFDHAFAHLLKWAPRGACKIVTVHDLAPLEDGSLTPSQLARFRRTLFWLNHADLLLSDSEATARALRDFLTAKIRISILSMGVDAEKFSIRVRPPVAALPPGPRLLSIGSVQSRKNLGVLPDFLREVVSAAGPVSLVRVGEALPAELRSRIESVLGAGRLVEAGLVDEMEVVAIYQASDVLVFPSTLEGFGFPLAEAMAAACPVVTSNASSLPEVGADAVLYFDPRDPAAGARQVVKLLKDSTLRTSLIERGLTRARELSWTTHAQRLASIYLDGAARN